MILLRSIERSGKGRMGLKIKRYMGQSIWLKQGDVIEEMKLHAFHGDIAVVMFLDDIHNFKVGEVHHFGSVSVKIQKESQVQLMITIDAPEEILIAREKEWLTD